MDFSSLQWVLTVLIIPSGAWLAKAYADSQDRFIKHLEMAQALALAQAKELAMASKEERDAGRVTLDKMRESIEANTRGMERHMIETQANSQSIAKALDHLMTRIEVHETRQH